MNEGRNLQSESRHEDSFIPGGQRIKIHAGQPEDMKIQHKPTLEGMVLAVKATDVECRSARRRRK